MKRNSISLMLFVILALTTEMYGQCHSTTHSPFEEHAWLSCEESSSPMNASEASHWVLFEFESSYAIDTLIIWNYNVWGNTNDGIKSIDIWLSEDKQNWTMAGQNIFVNKAPGSWKYSKPDSIYLSSLTAKYLALDVNETWGTNACAGISEIQFVGEQLTSTDELLTLEDENLVLYPNPVSNQLRLINKTSLEFRKMQIYNSLGQLVKNLNEIPSILSNIDVSDLQPGIYSLMINTDSGFLQRQFVKSNNN